ncbi:hypothetical protein PTKIN_Ptkin14bG0170300 [Pterospermum kingtungense]
MNNLYGKIPDSFRNEQLRDLVLNDNQLEGLVPRSLANCSYLQILHLGNNELTDTFPHWLASLPRLEVLILRFNALHGSLPDSIASSNFSALRIIDLSGNEFTGSLPTKFIRNLRAMKDSYRPSRSPYRGIDGYDYYETSVVVRTKRLNTELVKILTIFRAMDFSNNLFSGQIPEELGELNSLQMLNLSRNTFTGPIPESPIPQANQFGTFDNDSYRGNLGLCGFPLSKQCGNEEETKPPAPKFKEDEGSGITSIWKLAMMGYGCGLVLGFSTGYIVFATRRPLWFVRMIEADWQRNVTRWIHRIQGSRNKHQGR